MTALLLISLTTLLLTIYLGFDLYTGRYYYLLNARNKSTEGFIRWWGGKNALFLALMAGAYLLTLLLSALVEWRQAPLNLVAMAVVCLFLALLGGRGRLSGHESGGYPPALSLLGETRRFWRNITPQKKRRHRDSRKE